MCGLLSMANTMLQDLWLVQSGDAESRLWMNLENGGTTHLEGYKLYMNFLLEEGHYP